MQSNFIKTETKTKKKTEKQEQKITFLQRFYRLTGHFKRKKIVCNKHLLVLSRKTNSWRRLRLDHHRMASGGRFYTIHRFISIKEIVQYNNSFCAIPSLKTPLKILMCIQDKGCNREVSSNQ